MTKTPILVDSLLVSMSQAAVNVAPIAKILKQIWTEANVFWVLKSMYGGNPSSPFSILETFQRGKTAESRAQKQGKDMEKGNGKSAEEKSVRL